MKKPGPRAISVTVTLALHAVAVMALLQFDAVRGPLLQAVPIMIILITPSPRVELPKPRPAAPSPIRLPQPRQIESPPVLAAQTVAPGPVLASLPPRPEPAPQAVSAAAAPAPAPLPIVAPVFDAAYLQNPPTAYPVMSKRRGDQGRVLLRVFVSTSGVAERIEVRESSGHERLDGAAREAVLGWRFAPARQGEKPVAAWVLVPITFSIGG